jgi:hypothetical protein
MNIDEMQQELDSIRENLRGTELYEKIEDIKFMKSSSPKFLAYQKSTARLALKKLREKIDGEKCTKCGSKKDLQFHHLTYERLYKELLTDGVTLCKTCHKLGHEAKNKILKKKEKMTVEIKKSTLENFKKHRQFIENWFYQRHMFLIEGIKDLTHTTDEFFAREFGETISHIIKMRQSCGVVGKIYPKTTNRECLVSIINFSNKIRSKEPSEIRAEIISALDKIEKNIKIEKPIIEKPKIFIGDLSEETMDIISRKKGRIKFPNGIEIDFS